MARTAKAMMETKRTLRAEAGKLIAWENLSRDNKDHVEPDYAYPDWNRLCEACVRFLGAVPPDRWEPEEVRLLLYVLCHDDDSHLVLDPMKKMPEAAIALADHALRDNARSAKIELAAILGNFSGRSDAEQVLLRLVKDEDEATSRYALMALARLGSARVEELVQRAWATGDVYQRMGSLHALFTTGSSRLSE